MSTPTPTPTKTRATPTPTKTKTPTPTPTRFPQRIPGCNNIGPVGTPGWVFVGGFTLQNAKLTRNQVIPFLNVPGTYKLVYQHGAYKKLGKWYGVSSDLGLTYNRIGGTPVTVSFPALSGASDQRLAESQSCGTEINVNMLSSVGVMSLTFSAGASGLSNIDGTTSTYETNGSGRNTVFRVFKQIPVTPTPTPTKTKPTPTPTRTPTTTPTKTKPTPTPTRTPTTTPTKPTPTPTRTPTTTPTKPTPTPTSIPVFQEICVELDENKQIQLIQGNVIPSIIFNPNGTTFYYSPTGNSVSNAQFGVIEPAYICSTDPKAFIKRRSNDWDLYWSSRLINGNYNKVCYNNHSSRMINSPYWRSVVNPSVPFNMVAQGSCSNNIPTPTPTPTSNVDIPNYPTPEGKIFTGQSIISQINSEYDVDTFWTELSTGFTYTIKVSGQNSPVIILKSYSTGTPLTPFQPEHTFVSTASAMRFDVSSAYYTGAPSSYVLTLSAKPTPAPTPTPSMTPTRALSAFPTPTPSMTPTRALSAFPTPTPTKTKTPTPSVTPTRGEADIPWYPTPQGLITVNNLKRSKLESFYDEDTFWTYVTPGSAYAVTVSGDTKSLFVAVRDYNNGSIINNYSPGSSFIASTTAVAFTVVSNYYYGGQFWPGIENYSLIVTSLTGGLPPVSPTPTPTKTKTPTPTPSRTPSYTWDSDATTYIQQVEARDGQALEINTKLAINTLVQGLKTDNTWNSLDVICLLAGARSLSGALVALKGPNPTNYNFTQSDYHRSIGLKGNGVDKWLDSNRLDSARPFNNIHMSVYMTRAGEPHDDERTNNNIHYCIGTDVGSYFISGSTGMYTQVEMSDIYTGIGGHGIAMGTNPPDPRPGLWGLTISSTRVELVCRELNDYYDPRDFQLDPAITQPSHKNLTLFYNGMSEEPLCNFSSHRMSCYTFGQNIDLYKLQNRLNTFFGTLSSVVSPPPLPTPTPSPTRPPTWSGNAIYSANYIPVTVQKNSNGNFDFVNLGNEPYNYGTNNPPLTCFRGANYNFNVNSGASTFALRNSYTDTTNVIGTYNNSPISGQVNNNVIMFTPLSGTPNQIVYMSPNTPELSGTITILD